MKQGSGGQIIVILCFCVGLTSLSTRINAQDSTSISSKLDTITMLQKKMYYEITNEPLKNKKYGIEFNLVRLLFIDEEIRLTGGFSLFNTDRKTEIAFPVYVGIPKDSKKLREFTLDCHYRYFLGHRLNGFYLSGFARYAYLNGYLQKRRDYAPYVEHKSSENKLGIGVGIGYRIFSHRGLYWGISLSVGRFFIGENDKFYGTYALIDDDEKYIIDCELLKFGWAF